MMPLGLAAAWRGCVSDKSSQSSDNIDVYNKLHCWAWETVEARGMLWQSCLPQHIMHSVSRGDCSHTALACVDSAETCRTAAGMYAPLADVTAVANNYGMCCLV